RENHSPFAVFPELRPPAHAAVPPVTGVDTIDFYGWGSFPNNIFERIESQAYLAAKNSEFYQTGFSFSNALHPCFHRISSAPGDSALNVFWQNQVRITVFRLVLVRCVAPVVIDGDAT